MSDEERDEDRDGTPDRLDDSFLPTGDADGEPAMADDADAPTDPAETRQPDSADGVDLDAPLGDLADRARRSLEGDGSDDVMDAFSEVDVEDVDVDQLWSELEDDRLEETVDEPRGSTERDVRVIKKRDYCQRCQYFSAPPDVRCNHESGEILEMVDTERFEVVDCPILRGEEELENLRR